jgi:hypothetical protein
MTTRKPRAYDRGLELWHLTPEVRRTAVHVLDELRGEGFRVSKASVCRWAKEWRRVVRTAADLVTTEPKPSPPQAVAPTDSQQGISPDLLDVLPPRLLGVARGKGIDAVEDAICVLSEAIGREAASIVEAGDKIRLRTTVAALGVLAGAVERIAAARSTPSAAHRSYCEGDRLLAEGEKLRAEAQSILSGARAASAKEITPVGDGAGRRPMSRSTQDEIMALLRRDPKTYPPQPT